MGLCKKPFAASGGRILLRLCKSLFMALRANLHFERHLIFEISRSEISKMRCLSKQYFAAEGGKIIFAERINIGPLYFSAI